MDFRNKVSDYAKTDKKGNMAYWDAIDNISEDYVRQILEMSTKKITIPAHMTEEDVILEVGKEITECIIQHLEENFGAEFPYVDENY